MKKTITALLLIVGVLTLSGCGGYETGDIKENGAWVVVGDKGHYDVLKDTETGCLYLQSHNGTEGITPYYDEHGDVMGCGEEHKASKF